MITREQIEASRGRLDRKMSIVEIQRRCATVWDGGGYDSAPATRVEAERRLLKVLRAAQEGTPDDAALTVVNVSDALEWYVNTSQSQRRELVEKTPARLMVPGMLLLGWTMEPQAFPVQVRDEGWVGYGGALLSRIDNERMEIYPVTRSYSDPVVVVKLDSAGFFRSFFRPTELLAQLEDDNHDRHFILTCLCLFHVRNMVLHPTRYPRTIRRQGERVRGEGPVVYHRLMIRPFVDDDEKDVDRQGERMGTGVQPWHQVRGHFAHYSEEHPLFGKYPGTFWREPHYAGNPAIARVRKQYDVSP